MSFNNGLHWSESDETLNKFIFMPFIPLKQVTKFPSENSQIYSEFVQSVNNPFVDVSRPDRWYIVMAQYWRVISFVLWYELFFNENIALCESMRQLAEESIAPAHYDSAESFTTYQAVSG